MSDVLQTQALEAKIASAKQRRDTVLVDMLEQQLVELEGSNTSQGPAN
jgi:hypothetical protein